MEKKQKSDLILLLCDISLVAMNTIWFAWSWYNFFTPVLYVPFFLRGNLAIVMVFMFINYSFSKIYGGFELKTNRAADLFYSLVIASVMTGITLFFVLFLLIRHLPPIYPLLIDIFLWSGTSAVWAKCASLIMRKVCPPERTLIVYGNMAAFRKGLAITKKVDWRFHVVDQISVQLGSDKVISAINQTNAKSVMLCGIHSSQRNDILKYCIASGIAVYIRPNIGDYIVNSSKQLQMASLPVMLCQRSSQSLVYLFLKRLFDIIFSLFFIILLSPLELIIAAAIHYYDQGPVFYTQTRLTKDSKGFKIYKFRSMKVDAEKDSGARLASQNDDRITPIGKIIRATRMDEFPQMFNILKGDMSVVGPRPERPEIAEEYEKIMPEFALRLQVKAGLTGYAAVHGKYNTSPYDKLQMDLMYIASQGLLTDFRIILETVKVVFVPESTEGIAEGQTTAEDSNDEDDE